MLLKNALTVELTQKEQDTLTSAYGILETIQEKMNDHDLNSLSDVEEDETISNEELDDLMEKYAIFINYRTFIASGTTEDTF